MQLKLFISYIPTSYYEAKKVHTLVRNQKYSRISVIADKASLYLLNKSTDSGIYIEEQQLI